MTPTILAHLALLSWLPLVLVLFMVYKPRRAIIMAFVGGWLLLPVFGYDLPGIPDWTKTNATSFSVLIAAFVFDLNTVLRFRLRWFDLPMIAWMVVPFISSCLNTDPTPRIPGLDWYEGLAAVMDQFIVWGVPYFIGRIYFTDLAAMRELAMGMVVGAILYFPLCLLEMRFSPFMHNFFYGFDQATSWRAYSIWELLQVPYQPRVFMFNGLALTMYMAGAALLAFWLAYTKAVRQLWGFPMSFWAWFTAVAAILCKSMGPNVLALIGGVALWFTSRIPVKYWAVALLLIAPTYMVVRGTNIWQGEPFLSIIEVISSDRALSMQVRFDNENMLTTRALERPIFGWGRWGRSRVYDVDTGKDISLVDGFWILTFGQFGFAGLTAMTATMLLPLVMFVRRVPSRNWAHPAIAPVAALSILVVIYVLDNLSNAFPNPIFAVVMGGIPSVLPATAMVPALQRRVRRVRSVVVRSQTDAAPAAAPEVANTPMPQPRTN
jgi:hypothetical protein